jgi:hypothetical protein
MPLARQRNQVFQLLDHGRCGREPSIVTSKEERPPPWDGLPQIGPPCGGAATSR